MTQIVSDMILQKVADEKKDGKTEKFIVVAYDLPSENISDLSPELKKELMNKRAQVGFMARRHCIYLSDSVYIISINRAEKFLQDFQEIYSSLGKKLAESVKLSIVGNAYTDTVLTILKNCIDKSVKEIKNELEIIEANIKNITTNSKVSTESVENRLDKESKKLSHVGVKLKNMKERIEDLKMLDTTLADNYSDTWTKISDFRKDLMEAC